MRQYPIARAAAISLLCVAILPAQEPAKLTARELFYTPVPGAAPAKAARPALPPQAAAKPKPKAQAPSRKTVKDAGEPAYQAHSTPPPPAELSGGAHIQTAAAVTSVPLALRYSILKRTDDSFAEVDPATVFHTGDKIRVEVEANDSGYLYIVQQGSSKAWNVLFPNADVENGNNRIERNHRYAIPEGATFTFDEQPGTERMFVILTRRPEPDMERLIYSLGPGNGKSPSPASGETKAEPAKLLMAGNRTIDDEVINRLRGQMLSRDLVFEKVDENTPPAKNTAARREKAVYVASPDRSPNARLVVDLSLNHQ